MFGIEHYSLFLLTGILLNMTPGNDTLFILGRTLSQGRRAGMMSVLGIVSGSLIHTAFAAFGLSIILMKSATAFNVVKWLGAGYLIYLGIKILISRSQTEMKVEAVDRKMLKKIYMQGLITNVLNPKVALFYLAFLPQFISPHNSYGSLPFIILGLTFIFNGTIWCLLLVWGSEFMARKVRKSKMSAYLNKITGAIFIFLGIKLLKSSNQL
ncbi:LysE family translocator [Cohnella mopanensis]|uniref:LysE family translocator n=1 Tax=Cohnella mopanensis TaxID=2911966 RepID=UPI001EF91C83|nr:LysE family translocator [Cohnella mopanensis]